MPARRWFVDLKDQTLRLIRELPEGADVDADTIQLAGELLLADLDRPDLTGTSAKDLSGQLFWPRGHGASD